MRFAITMEKKNYPNCIEVKDAWHVKVGDEKKASGVVARESIMTPLKVLKEDEAINLTPNQAAAKYKNEILFTLRKQIEQREAIVKIAMETLNTPVIRFD
ncbi:MAG: hypothetical protein V1841_00050 [Patescibacteria group bacterium]